MVYILVVNVYVDNLKEWPLHESLISCKKKLEKSKFSKIWGWLKRIWIFSQSNNIWMDFCTFGDMQERKKTKIFTGTINPFL